MKLGLNTKAVGIIPARYHSTRFPGKPLIQILGKSLIQRTYENSQKATTLCDLVVATDDQRIFDHVLGFGGKAVLTSNHWQNGSERVAEAAEKLSHFDIVVNIQGDEPCIDPVTIDSAVRALQHDSDAVVATAAAPLAPEEAHSTSIVKCVKDLSGRALYFSRAAIPGSKTGSFNSPSPFLRHVGLYAFRREFLFQYAKLAPTPHMIAEDLEQLKVLEHGFKMQVVTVFDLSSGVDTPEDIAKVEKILCQQNMSL